jgi:signal transduction histidine kinase
MEESKSGAVNCCLSDTGIGIRQGDLEKVFEKYHRSDNAVKSGQKGVGLGLAISKSIVEAHGGTIHIESDEGKGTKVFFTFPKVS